MGDMAVKIGNMRHCRGQQHNLFVGNVVGRYGNVRCHQGKQHGG